MLIKYILNKQFFTKYILYIYKSTKVERKNMSGNSLQKYKDSVICSNTNKGWPLVNQSTDNTGNPNRIYSTNVGTLLNGQNTPQINWGSPTVPDRILYSNGLWNSASSSSSSSKSGNGFAIFGTIISSLGAVFSLLPLISMFTSKKDGDSAQNTGFSKSERKEISQNTTNSNDSMTALNSCINTANSVDENTSSETLANVNNNLKKAIETAEAQKSDALRNVETAKAAKKPKTRALQNEQVIMDGLLNEKADLTKEIGDLKKQLENSELSDKQKDTIKKQIDNLEKQLKETEDKIEDSQKKIDDIQAAIDVQDEIIKRNTQTSNAIETRLKAARQAAAKVNNIIESKENK